MTRKYTLVVQDLLYHRPLFQYIGKDEADMNVLVLGWNTFSEAFVDQCLQAGQMDLHFLNIKVLSPQAEQQEKIYLEKRSALNQFVNVNGSLSESDLEIYARLDFVEFNTEGFKFEEHDSIADTVMDILAEAPNEKYHYFLVSLGNDDWNKKAAETLKEIVDEFMPSEISIIHYVCEGAGSNSISNGIVPVLVRNMTNITDVNPDLERMAYNAHMIWDDAINGDALAELEKFRKDDYKYLSSIALALSIKYKLSDFGIDSEDYEMAANQFWNMLQSNENQETINRVIALEHRRWVINLICQGWTAPKPEERQKYYDACSARKGVRDDDNRIHPCITRSTVETPLSTGIFLKIRLHGM